MRFLRNIIILLVLLVFVVLGAWFYQDNPEPVGVVFLGVQTLSLPKSIWLLTALMIGCLLGIATSYPILFRLKAEIRSLKGQVAGDKKKVAKSVPVVKV